MGAMYPGTLRFRNPIEREQARILAARLLVRIAKDKREPIDPEIAAAALRPVPTVADYIQHPSFRGREAS